MCAECAIFRTEDLFETTSSNREMSKHETPLTKRFWRSVGGTLVLEFPAISRSTSGHGKRFIDGVIIVGGEKKIAKASEVDIEGKDIIVIQAKRTLRGRLGMNVLGQAFFSVELMKRFKPKSIRSVTIVNRGDEILEPIAAEHGVEVVVY